MQSASPKRLVICADDFAFSEGVSVAVAQLARLGRVTATSAMVLSPRWSRDAALLSELRGRIDVGLHLDWTSEFAAGAGHGLSLGQAMVRSITGRFDHELVKGVIERQLDAFEAHWKSAPDHVDGHQHVHQFNGIRAPLLEILDRRYGTGAGPYLRVSRPVGGVGLKGRVIAAMGAAPMQRELVARGRAGSPALTGLYGFDGMSDGYAALAEGWLHAAPAGTILMCHPASQALPDDAIGAARMREFDFWRSAGASAALARANAVPARGPGRPPGVR